MSMLGVAFLNEIIADQDGISPADLLAALKTKIITELEQKGDPKHSRDGMDISLLRFEYDRLHEEEYPIEWAGANNPLYLISNGELTEFKGDRQSIGYNVKPKDFNNHTITVRKGDLLYIFSDGYWDQFGGPKFKKIGRQNFKEYLMAAKDLDLNKQKDFMIRQLEEWKGTEDQTDDILIIGVKV